MSNAFYPLGMKSYNNHTNQGGYVSWKGTGVFSNPVGITAGNIRPLTNNDSGNNSSIGFGLPRPIKHYRKGRAINNNTGVASSTGGTLIKQMLDYPGGYNIFPNTLNEVSNITNLNNHCNTCNGIGVISDWMPINNLTEKPEASTQTAIFCCNDEKKALKRTRPANTNLKKKYYTTTSQYLYNRCQTFEQQQFNYLTSGNSEVKPGGPLSINNNYVGNCNPNLDIDNPVIDPETGISYSTITNPAGCKQTQYKPNNYNFGTQGAVSSSDHILRLNVNTINTNKSNINSLNLNKSKYFEGGSNGVSKIFYIPTTKNTITTNNSLCSALCPNDCPSITLSDIATQSGTNWTLIQNITILKCQTLRILYGETLTITSGQELINEGTINNFGTITNSGTLKIVGTLNNFGTNTNSNSGTLKIEGTLNNFGTIANSNLITTEGGISGIINNNADGIITNNVHFYIQNKGTLNNSGTINNTTSSSDLKIVGTLNNSGTITNYNSAEFTTDIDTSGIINNNIGGEIINNGTFFIRRVNTLNNYGTITNSLSKSLKIDGTLNNYATITNIGTITKETSTTGIINNSGGTIDNSGTGTLKIFGTLNNSGLITNDTSGDFTTDVSVLTTVTINNSGTITNSGTLGIKANIILNNSGTITNSGTLTNKGTLNVSTSSGILKQYGTLTNSSGAFIYIYGAGTLHVYTSFTNQASIVYGVSSGSCGLGTITYESGTTITNSGSGSITSGCP